MRSAVALLLTLALAGCEDGGGAGGLPPVADAGPKKDALPVSDGAPAMDAGPVSGDAGADADLVPAMDAAPAGDLGPEPDASPPDGWPLRACDTTIRFAAPPGAREVLLAGEFTNWQQIPLPLTDPDGDGVFERRLSPDDGLIGGQRYAYKLIVDGHWRIDPGARLHKYDGDCVNSALELPRCAAGPEILGEPVDARADGATVRFAVHRPADGARVEQVTATLNGEPLALPGSADGRFTLDLDLAAGRHVVAVRARDAQGRAAEPVDLVFWVEPEAFDWRDGVLYLLFIDRFANGDRGNDGPIGDPVPYPADWHGGDLQGALAVLRSGYFERLGVRHIWLSPVNRQVDGHFADRGGDGRRFAAYHGYWPVEGREVEPRFGGDAALRAFVDEAHRRGIRVLLDLINNQVHEQHTYYREHPQWFRTACVCGVDPGCGWSERPLDCLFAAYLPDINWRVREAEDRFIADALWWVEEFGVDGFRVDAVKHVETSSVYNLRAALARRFEQGGTRVVMLGETAVGEHDRFDDGCGEVYPDGYAWIEAYTGETALDGQFDFPTHHRLQWGVLTGEMGYGAVEAAVAAMEARYSPDALHVQFLGSHDSSRMASRAAYDPARDCNWPGGGACGTLAQEVNDPAVFARLRRAWTLLLTLPGVPLLYYGDEIALAGGNDPDNRRDMPWSGDLRDLAMRPDGPSEPGRALQGWLEALAAARAAHPALTRGERLPLVADPDLYVYARRTEDDLAIVALNRGGDVHDHTVLLGALAGELPTVRVVAGAADARVEAGTLRLSIPAGESAILAR